MKALWISNSGLSVEEKRLDLIANNISNIQTPGYKFQTALVDEIFDISNDGDIKFSGAQIKGINRNFSDGDITFTGRALDLAIDGEGFLEVLLPDETIGYIKTADLQINADGYIVTSDGYKLYPEIQIPEDTISIVIAKDGTVTVKKADGNSETLGQLELARFVNKEGLKYIGGGVYKLTNESGDAIIGNPGEEGMGKILQGYLENSNVKLADEMIKMIMAQRSYQINAKIIQTADRMMEMANNIVR